MIARRNSTREYLPLDGILARYPRLVRAACWAACLSTHEAASCIQMWRAGHAWAGEAVNHYGGCRAVLLGAIRCRFAARRAYPRRAAA